eukprot:4896277-Ditylum_brightwellii.AAC.2
MLSLTGQGPLAAHVGEIPKSPAILIPSQKSDKFDDTVLLVLLHRLSRFTLLIYTSTKLSSCESLSGSLFFKSTNQHQSHWRGDMS